MAFYDSDTVTQYIVDKLEDHKGELGFRTVVYGDERLIRAYPSVLVEPAPLQREVHASRQWMLTFRVNIWIYHALLKISRQQRVKEDVQLSNSVVTLMHEDKTFAGNLIFCFIENEAPGIIGRGPEQYIIGTRLGWTGQVTQPWDL